MALGAPALAFEGEWRISGRDSSHGAYSGGAALRRKGEGFELIGEVLTARGQRLLRRAQARLQGGELVIEEPESTGLVGALRGLGAAQPAELGRLRKLAADSLTGSWRFSPASAASESWSRITLPERRAAAAYERLDGGFIEDPRQRAQLNANDPEIITRVDEDSCIAVSTLGKLGKTQPEAHLGYSFSGPFRIFVSNQNRSGGAIFQVIALHNPGVKTVKIQVEALASSSTGEAPYADHSAPETDIQLWGKAVGPGEAAAARVLKGEREGPAEIFLAPGQSRALHIAAHPKGQELVSQAELRSDGPVQAAVIYFNSAPDEKTLQRALIKGKLLTRSSHDKTPTPPGASGALIFGRVAGVVGKSSFLAKLSNLKEGSRFALCGPETRRYAWNTKLSEQLGTGINDAAPVLARTAMSAYASHGNYGAEFLIRGEFFNPTGRALRLSIFVDSPAPPGRPGVIVSRALRNTLRLTLRRSPGTAGSFSDFHISQRRGAISIKPIHSELIGAGGWRELELRLFYAANNTCPHVLRVEVQEP